MLNKESKNITIKKDYSNAHLRTIYLAGGCFWGVQAYLRRINGVVSTLVGYANGHTKSPTYVEVSHFNTGHAETVRVKYNPKIISLTNLLSKFFEVIDPTVFNRQGNDVGSQYRTGVYFVEKQDEKTILQFIEDISSKYTSKIVTEVEPLSFFYKAEEYHQSYLEKNPWGYCHIKIDR